MKLKKYEARTEQEAIEKVKDELGLEALILNIKKTQPKGVFAIFRKPLVEVTAAYEEKSLFDNKEQNKVFSKDLSKDQDKGQKEDLESHSLQPESSAAALTYPGPDFASVKETTITVQQERIKTLERKLSSSEGLLEKMVSRLTIAEQSNFAGNRKYENSMIQIFYDTLVEQGVTPEIAEEILETVNSIEEADKIDLPLVAKIVYNKIVNILGEPASIEPIKSNGDPAKLIAFIGPTGVGKTTTIAKLSSLFMLNNNLRVGMITADTYRIAAVEQLKTYAEILGIEVGVVYNTEDLEASIKMMSSLKDIVLIDTAGRSHKNEENLMELNGFLSLMPPDSEKFLVLSVTTKFDDLMTIVKTYSDITDFKMIFTKLDETNCFGSILNICYLTGKKISYVTNGQNVPEDIEVTNPEKLAKALLGLGGSMS